MLNNFDRARHAHTGILAQIRDKTSRKKDGVSGRELDERAAEGRVLSRAKESNPPIGKSKKVERTYPAKTEFESLALVFPISLPLVDNNARWQMAHMSTISVENTSN